ncbi:family 16 glycosylhydrolase [Pseudonocardia sp. HH130630-07]|uniref:family 16 glycosylhydrolase n=1 Tax=Pseudonocardia sp. HH130630-07 TaxID=1690815 RepID=UPI0018D4D31A|nr:family 16 glycosylhydrolase [Pseudonocardia sp. HH130630-07]
MAGPVKGPGTGPGAGTADDPGPGTGTSDDPGTGPGSGTADDPAVEPGPANLDDPVVAPGTDDPQAAPGPSDAEEPAVTDPSARPADQSVPKPGAPTAAERFGWGTPLPASDEFDYTGPPDPERWNTAGECWPGHAGNGGRCASRSTVKDGKLVQAGLENGDSAWLASRFDQQYGRWEARVRSEGTGPDNGRQYHPLLIIWPQSDRWPDDGEYDFLENGAPGEQCAEAFIHYPHGRGAIQQEFVRESDCGAPLSEWHNVAVEWTPDHIAGFIDGEEWFRFSGGAKGNRRAIQDMPSGHLTIQLDNFFGGDMQPAEYEIDWVRIYSLDDD